ncbi:MAG: outer membrane beta-barrel protein [Alphaproteobacteria bacterium]|nr:outer membrane beta-barrel protein [Alphaproteobacteria bacterium]
MNIKKSMLYALCSMLCIGAANAATVDFYVGAMAGLGSLQTGGTNSFAQSYGALVGLDMPVVRAEVEYSYIHSTRSGADLNANLAFVNGYVKLTPTPMVKPYVGLGIGTLFAGSVSAGGVSEDMNTQVAYQGMLGVQSNIPATSLFVDVEYRTAYAPNIFEHADFWQNEVRLKLRYAF